MGTNKINKIMASMPWNKAKKNAYISDIRRRYAQKTHSRENNAKVLVEIYSDIVTRIHQGEK